MYIVGIVRQATGELIDERSFKFGDWTEIGLWLDYKGYNDSRYRATINFVD